MKIKANNAAKLALALFFVLGFAFLTSGAAKADGTRAKGETCAADSECASGYCDIGVTGKCVDILPCNATSHGRVLCVGASGTDVKRLQEALKNKSYTIAVDCQYGTETESIVTKFQTDKGLKHIDGKAGPETLGALGLSSVNLQSTGASCGKKAVGEVCTGDNECASGHCPAGTCVAAAGGKQGVGGYCDTDNDCETGLTCRDDNQCANPKTADGGSCGSSSQCQSGVCTDGKCAASSSSGDCGGDANLVNVNGLCVPKSNFGGIAGATDWGSLAKKIIDILLTVSGVIAVLFILYGGFLYISSGGNEEQAEKGRKALFNAIIGLVVVLLSFVIVQVLANLITS